MQKKHKVWKKVVLGGIDVNLVLLTPKNSGFPQGSDRKIFWDHAQSSLGLRLCPVGLAQELRTQYQDQKVGELLRVVEEPSIGPKPRAFLLKVRGTSRTPQLPYISEESYKLCWAGEKWLFALPPASDK